MILMAKVAKKYITVNANDMLFELGYIQGPIINPCWISIEVIKRLLSNGRVVYEHDIDNPKNKVRLTKDNYAEQSKFPTNAEVTDPSSDANTFRVTLQGINGGEDMPAGTMYVEIL